MSPTEEQDWSDERRTSLRDSMRACIPDGAPMWEVLSAIGTMLCEVCEDNDLEPERAIKALGAGLASYRKRSVS